jgi:hypothetical protein
MNVKDFSELIDNAPDVNKYGMNGWNLQRGLDVCVRIQEREGKPMSMRRVLLHFVDAWDEMPLEILGAYITWHGEGETLAAFQAKDKVAYSKLAEAVTAAYATYVDEIADEMEAAFEAILERDKSKSDGD